MKTFLLMLLTVTLANLNDKYHNPNESAIVYYSPETSIVLDFAYTEEKQEVGPFALFAEELLGIKDAVMENSTTYIMKDVHIQTRTGVDLSRAHKVVAEKGMLTQLLNINERGILIGYNLPQQIQKPKNNGTKEDVKYGTNMTSIIPYSEDILEVKSVAGQAKAVAKQIFRIRESRMYLLGGEVEHAPADGVAMKLVLEDLDKYEKQLIELFVGKKTTNTLHKQVLFCPRGDDLKQWSKDLYFSEENGFTAEDNIDAQKIEIRAEFQHQLTQERDAKKNKKGVELSQIMYNLPGNAEIIVTYKDEIFGKRMVPIAQFGIDIPLPRDLFTGSELPVIVFSEKTGNILSISK